MNGYIHRFFIFEGFILGIAAILALFFGRSVFYSVVLGAALVILPQLYFPRKVFRYRGAKFSQAILRDFYTGEARMTTDVPKGGQNFIEMVVEFVDTNVNMYILRK